VIFSIFSQRQKYIPLVACPGGKRLSSNPRAERAVWSRGEEYPTLRPINAHWGRRKGCYVEKNLYYHRSGKCHE